MMMMMVVQRGVVDIDMIGYALTGLYPHRR
jgi:hypothetical protein